MSAEPADCRLEVAVHGFDPDDTPEPTAAMDAVGDVPVAYLIRGEAYGAFRQSVLEHCGRIVIGVFQHTRVLIRIDA
jgi:hypothetical protein